MTTYQEQNDKSSHNESVFHSEKLQSKQKKEPKRSTFTSSSLKVKKSNKVHPKLSSISSNTFSSPEVRIDAEKINDQSVLTQEFS